MIEEIVPNLYHTQIPLPRSPLKWLNSYIIRGNGRFLIIDTGFNHEDCLNEMTANLKTLNVDLDRTDIFITHRHVDHIGLSGKLATPTSKVYLNEREARTYVGQRSNWMDYWRRQMEIFIANGFPAEGADRVLDNHPGHNWGLDRRLDFTTLKNDDPLDIGDFHFRCLSTPGHSVGHMCLYEPEKKILITGDLILFDISPNIAFWLDMEDSLGEYLTSLEKVEALDVKYVLTGHRRLLHDHRQRIVELREHHRRRLNEVLAALEAGEKNVLQIAPFIHWDVKAKSWEEFPPPQKWFSFSEVLAHVRYLEIRGKVKRNTRDGKITYTL